MTPAEAAVRAAAALLPRRSRDRYREQWLADLRDSPEAGLRPSGIALGSLAFAVTVARPLPSRARATAALVDRRSRLAVGLALACAAVALTRFADLLDAGGLSGIATLDSVLSVSSMLLTAFGFAAPVVAVGLVAFTRGVSSDVRIAVFLFVLAGLAPVAQAAIDVEVGNASIFFSRGAAAYAVALALIVTAALLSARGLRRDRVREPRSPRRRGVVTAVGGGGVVVLVSALAISDLVERWAERAPLEFRGDSAGYADWVLLEARAEATVSSVFVWFAVAAVLAGAAIVVHAAVRRSAAGTSVALALATHCLVAVAYAGVVGFVGLMAASARPTPLVDSLMALGRWGLVGTALVTVGGLRLAGRGETMRGETIHPEPAPAADAPAPPAATAG